MMATIDRLQSWHGDDDGKLQHDGDDRVRGHGHAGCGDDRVHGYAMRNDGVQPDNAGNRASFRPIHSRPWTRRKVSARL